MLLIEAYRLYLKDTFKDVNQETSNQLLAASGRQEEMMKERKIKELDFLRKHPTVALNRTVGKGWGYGHCRSRYAAVCKCSDIVWSMRRTEIENHLDSIGRASKKPNVQSIRSLPT